MKIKNLDLSPKDWELCCTYIEDLKQKGLSACEPWVCELEAWAANPHRLAHERETLPRLPRAGMRDTKTWKPSPGNGGHEIRDWLAVAGAMPQRPRPEVLAYEPLKPWFTGTGIMAWSA